MVIHMVDHGSTMVNSSITTWSKFIINHDETILNHVQTEWTKIKHADKHDWTKIKVIDGQLWQRYEECAIATTRSTMKTRYNNQGNHVN